MRLSKVEPRSKSYFAVLQRVVAEPLSVRKILPARLLPGVGFPLLRVSGRRPAFRKKASPSRWGL